MIGGNIVYQDHIYGDNHQKTNLGTIIGIDIECL